MKDHLKKKKKENTCIFQQQKNRVALVSHVFSMKQCIWTESVDTKSLTRKQSQIVTLLLTSGIIYKLYKNSRLEVWFTRFFLASHRQGRLCYNPHQHAQFWTILMCNYQ